MGAEEKSSILTDLAEIIGGRVEGNGDTRIVGVCSLGNPRADHIAPAFATPGIDWGESDERPAALIVSRNVDIEGLPLLIHENPRLAFTLALRHFHREEKTESGIDENASVAADAKVDSMARVGPFAVIESGAEIGPGARIGAGCFVGTRSTVGRDSILYPNVTVLHDVTIGERCIIHSGVVIGGDGFGFTPTGTENLKVPQIGRVEIGNDVEIGANTTIDRATLDVTRIEDDVKIDNLVQIAHNCRIGAHTRIAAQAGFSGRVNVEENVVVLGQAGFQNGITIGKGSIVGGRAGVTRDVAPASKVSGYPARDHYQSQRLIVLQGRLPEIVERLEKLEHRLDEED